MAIISSDVWNTLSLSATDEYYQIVQDVTGYSDILTNFGVVVDRGFLEYNITFKQRGQQVFNTSADDEAWLYIDGRYQGKFGLKSQPFLLKTIDYYEANTTHKIQIIANNFDPKTNICVGADWYDYEYSPVNIKSFYASPNPLYAINGLPSQTVTLIWDVVNYTKLEIDQGVGNVTNVQESSRSVNTELKSIVPSRSPATKRYTLRAYGNLESDIIERFVNVQVFNDNTPDNFEIPNASFQANFFDREPNELIEHPLGVIRGLDMNTIVLCSDGVQATTNITEPKNWSGNLFISPNQTLTIRFRTPPLNPDPEGLPNVVEHYVEIGTVRKYFLVSTRSPYTDENFDFEDNSEVYPYPKIHTTPFPTPEPYIVSNVPGNAALIIDDTDLSNVDTTSTQGGIEIKTTLNDQVEVRYQREFNWSEWTHPNKMYDDFNTATPRTLQEMDMDYLSSRSNSSVTNNKPKEITTRSSGKLFAKNVEDF